MPFPAHLLRPVSGEIHSEIFPLKGRLRYSWEITFQFEPFVYADYPFKCGASCANIEWPLRHWRELNGQSFNRKPYGSCPDFECNIEATFYTTCHDEAPGAALKLRHTRENLFLVTMDLLVNFHGFTEGDADPFMPVRAEMEIPYRGVLFRGDWFTPHLTTAASASELAKSCIDLDAYQSPTQQNGAWRFEPKF